MASLPFAPYLRETGIIKAPVSKVWPVVSKIQAWMPIHRSLSKAEKVLDDAGEPTDFVRWHLGEGHEILCKIEAIDNLDYMVKFSTAWSKLPLEYVGVCTTIRCSPITHGFAKGYTFISMDGEYTTDCNPAMIAKGKRRRHEFFDDVNAYFEKQEAGK